MARPGPSKKKTPQKKVRRRTRDIVFPNRPATIRDLARFADWAGIRIGFATQPKEPEDVG